MNEEQDLKEKVQDLKDKVVKAIKSVYDPEIPVDIYELGLIYEINVYPINNVAPTGAWRTSGTSCP